MVPVSKLQSAPRISRRGILLLESCDLFSALQALTEVHPESVDLSLRGRLKQKPGGNDVETAHPDYVNTGFPNWMLMLRSEMLIASSPIRRSTEELHCGWTWKPRSGPRPWPQPSGACFLRSALSHSICFGVVFFLIAKMLKWWFCIKGLKGFGWKTRSNAEQPNDSRPWRGVPVSDLFCTLWHNKTTLAGQTGGFSESEPFFRL